MPASRCHPNDEILPCSEDLIPGSGDAPAPSLPSTYLLVLPNLKTTYGRLRRTYILIWDFSKHELKRISRGLWSGRKKHKLISISSVPPGQRMVVIAGWCLSGSRIARDALGRLLAAALFLEGKGAAIPSPARSRQVPLLPLCLKDPKSGAKKRGEKVMLWNNSRENWLVNV